MKRRTTYLQQISTPFDPAQARLSSKVLEIRGLLGAKEERVTVALDDAGVDFEDGDEATRFLVRGVEGVSVRWAKEVAPHSGSGSGSGVEGEEDGVTPFASRVSPGLHVYFTPRVEGEGGDTEAVCRVLKGVFGLGLKCLDYEKSFTRSDVTSSPETVWQYYSPLASLDGLVEFFQRKVCGLKDGEGAAAECRRQAAELLAADSVDISYDASSRALVLSGFWSEAPGGEGWTEYIRAPVAGSKDKMEVGFLGAERAVDPEEIKMGGLLGVVGEDDKLKPTLFSFPSRHHALPRDAVFSVSFPSPTGLHPTMAVSMSPAALQRPPASPDATCTLHTYLTLPSYIFGDKYQLGTDDRLFLESHHLVKLQSVTGETDLEAPDWSVSRWGSNWLFEVATPPADRSPEHWNVTIPLHLRYLHPSESGYRSAAVPWPVVFWACTASEEARMQFNPFDRVDLGWEGLFGPQTVFYQVHPAAEQGRLVEEVNVPVLKANGIFSSKTIELGTVVAIVLGSLWVLWKLGTVVWGSGPQKRAENQKKSQ